MGSEGGITKLIINFYDQSYPKKLSEQPQNKLGLRFMAPYFQYWILLIKVHNFAIFLKPQESPDHSIK